MTKLSSTDTLLSLAVLSVFIFLPTGSRAQDGYKSNASVLACSPNVLGPNDTLILRLGPKHGSELAIRRLHDQTSYFLVIGSPPAEMKPLMTTEAFSRAKEVKIPAGYEAVPWASDSKKAPIFSKSGKYVVQVSDNLESHGRGHYCNVQFVAK